MKVINHGFLRVTVASYGQSFAAADPALSKLMVSGRILQQSIAPQLSAERHTSFAAARAHRRKCRFVIGHTTLAQNRTQMRERDGVLRELFVTKREDRRRIAHLAYKQTSAISVSSLFYLKVCIV